MERGARNNLFVTYTVHSERQVFNRIVHLRREHGDILDTAEKGLKETD